MVDEGAGAGGSLRAPLASDADVVRARHLVRDRAVALGLGLVTQTKLVTATSELARNAVVHGGGGEVVVEVVERTGARGVRVVVTDHGPGIDDVELAMREGWTSGGGLGLGLPGARRLVHDFELTTAPGRGTSVAVTVWDPPR